MSEHPQPSDPPVEAIGGASNSARTQQIVIQQRDGWAATYRLLATIGWAGFVICGLWALGQLVAFASYFDTTGGLTERYHSGSKFAADKVAVLHISGVIMDGQGFVKRQIDRIKQDDSVKAVVLRVNSPGGTITGSDYILHHLNKLREDRKIPLVVSMGSIAASGGYYVSMAVGDQQDTIFAEPTTTTGSIGVIVPHYDVSGLMQRFDVKDDSVASHPRKQMLSMTRPMNDDDRLLVERYVNEAFDRFKEIVKSGRPAFRTDDETLDRLATGEVFTARQALEHGLIDQIGFIEDAIEHAVALAGLEQESTRVVDFERPVTLMDVVGLNQVHERQQSPLESLLELTVPRAYYLCTSL
jgi:protease-4